MRVNAWPNWTHLFELSSLIRSVGRVWDSSFQVRAFKSNVRQWYFGPLCPSTYIQMRWTQYDGWTKTNNVDSFNVSWTPEIWACIMCYLLNWILALTYQDCQSTLPSFSLHKRSSNHVTFPWMCWNQCDGWTQTKYVDSVSCQLNPIHLWLW